MAESSKTTIIVPISAPTPEAMTRLADQAMTCGAEAIELRVDALTEPGGPAVGRLVAQIRQGAGSSRPLVVTCRDKREGGILDHSLSARIDAWAGAIGAGADFVDVELDNIQLPQVAQPIREALAGRPRTRLVVSSHSWKGRFAAPQRRYDECRAAYPGAVPKLVYTANHINDCFDALDLLRDGRGDKVVFCMGQAGSITRLLAKKLGALMTYASLDPASGTAPGQIPIDQMKGLYRSDSIDSSTEVYGVVGDPVAHSMSPAIHNACFARRAMNRLYLPVWVAGSRDELFGFLDAIRARPWLGLRGLSVTVPHKQGALEYVKARGGQVDPLAARIGAVNTLLLDPEGGIKALNTDYVGAMEAIFSAPGMRRDDLRGWPVAVVGAGGVARAVVAGLRDTGAQVTIYNRTVSKAKALAQEFGCAHAPLDDLANVKARLLINCTSIGMYPEVESTPVPAEYLRPDMVVFDTVYNPPQTQLLRQASDKGATCIDGVTMFVDQAQAQFRLFTGQDADPALMREVITRSLAGASPLAR
jgi:3-dehydroquinate dehydratase/shikimate dehydrogenase